mgnify:CR=1 FL=1
MLTCPSAQKQRNTKRRLEMNLRDLLRRSKKIWNVDYIPQSLNRRNQHEWVRAVVALGDKWLLAQKQPKLETKNEH